MAVQRTELGPGKIITSDGVVHVQDYAMLPSSTPEGPAHPTWQVFNFGDTTGPLVVVKEVDVAPGEPWLTDVQQKDADAIYVNHGAGTGEVEFIVVNSDGKQERYVVGPRGRLFVRAGLSHSARNIGDEVAYMAVTYVRNSDPLKGRNIPLPSAG